MNEREKKIKIANSFRLVLQIIFFIILPALYIQTLNGIKQIYIAFITQSFDTSILPQLIEVIAIIPITIIIGRFFCGWMCAFGSFSDFIYLISSKVFKKKWKISQEVDAALKYIKYIILAVVVVAIWSLDLTIFESASPWDAFGMLVTIGELPDFSYVLNYLLIGFLFFVGIIIGSAFIERFFCRYLCPLGAVFAVVSSLRIGKIRKPREKCGNCRICTNNCAMGIPLYETDVVKSTECINCMKCVSACPLNNASYAVADKDVRSLVVSAVSVAVIAGSYYATDYSVNAAGNNVLANSYESSQSSNVNKMYNDGTYEGTGTGFRNGTTTVSVTIENDQITNIETVSHEDDRPFYEKASSVIEDIISDQSTDVDTVSGATFSSLGIIEAVTNALNQAKISETATNDTTTAPSVTQDSETEDSETEDIEADESEADDSGTEDSDSEITDSEQFDKEEPGFGHRGKGNREKPDFNTETNESDATDTEANDTEAADTDASDEAANTEAAENEATVTQAPATVSATQYKDGTYQGSGIGFKRGTTTVTVEVSGGKITTIDVVSYEDDRPFFERAFDTVTQDIIDSQSTDVDSVSGATFSSVGIMDAVADALSTAVN